MNDELLEMLSTRPRLAPESTNCSRQRWVSKKTASRREGLKHSDRLNTDEWMAELADNYEKEKGR
jgi:hypothetical protein